MPTPQKSFLPVRTARSANIHPRSASSLEDSGLAVEYARETDLKPPGHRSLKAQKRELKAAAEAEKAWRGQAKTETQMRKLSKSWGPYATSGIPPEELLYMTRENMTHAWGPKPRNVDRPCQIREGIVTKRMRIDRALLSRNKVWLACVLVCDTPVTQRAAFAQANTHTSAVAHAITRVIATTFAAFANTCILFWQTDASYFQPQHMLFCNRQDGLFPAAAGLGANGTCAHLYLNLHSLWVLRIQVA